MKVLKVIVDELPEKCTECQFHRQWDERWVDCWAILEISMPIEAASKQKPDWCPLVKLSDIDGNVIYHLQKKIYGKVV